MKKLINNITFKIIFIYCYFCSSFILADNINDIKGYKVNFDYTNHQTEREIVYKYLIDRYGNDEPILEKNQIGIDLYDINNDGKKEILIYIKNSGLCRSAGCLFEILQLYPKNHKLKKVERIFSMNIYDGIKVQNNITLGSHDLLLDIKFDRYTIWRWNGEIYKLTKKLSKVSKEESSKSFFKDI